ncbi:sensor histidine kinase [Novisyntrophococcus fermenticellae]|uniref:sensor histidine kinase n=1 Tax=Novisyntrophococcus fermenticellae TaxID=2068655 RepID=UPI001E2C0C7C|nr:sensor histidine kinase [Novisyntrophococcus fermenticellae]
MKYLKKMSIRNRIIFLSIALAVSVSGIYSVSYYRSMAHDLDERLMNQAEAISFQVSSYMEERLETLITSVYTMVSSPMYTTTLQNYLLGETDYQYALTLTRINELIAESKMREPFIHSIYIHTPKGDFYDLSYFQKTDFEFTESRLYQEYQTDGGPKLYRGAKGGSEIYAVNDEVIPLVLTINISGYSGAIYVVIYIDSKEMNQYLSRSTSGNENIMVQNKHKQLIAANNEDQLAQYNELLEEVPEEAHWVRNDKECILSSDQIGKSVWKVVVLEDKASNRGTLQRGLELIVFLILISAAIASLSSVFFSNKILGPLSDLQDKMLEVTKGDFSKRYEYPYKNEVGKLADGFNYMVEKLGEYVLRLNITVEKLKKERDYVKQEQVLKRKAELNMLQAQINPHFLHNTLNSIIWLAAEEDTEAISTLASELAHFYEYRIRGYDNTVHISDEIDQVKSYLVIQRMRYGNSIEYFFEIEEELLEYPILKLVLQPLVENAIFHGVQCKENPEKEIRIKVVRKGDFDAVLEVEDNGVGIAKEKLEQLNYQLSIGYKIPEEGYGIFNVNERIKLYFGMEYGLSLASEKGEGTRAFLCIPLLDKEVIKRS